MARSGRDADKRLKTAKKRKASSQRWLERQINDPYVKRAKDEGWRSRAAFKLSELDDRFNLVKGAKRVVDLGLAPGGWSQVVRKRENCRRACHCAWRPRGSVCVCSSVFRPGCDLDTLACHVG